MTCPDTHDYTMGDVLPFVSEGMCPGCRVPLDREFGGCSCCGDQFFVRDGRPYVVLGGGAGTGTITLCLAEEE